MSGVVTYPFLGRNGRLGNQLFQIAATFAYAKKTGKTLHLPEWDYEHFFLNYPKLESLDNLPGANNYTNLKEQSFSFNELPNIEGNVSLDGYFQSEKYFKEYSGEIKKMFEFSPGVYGPIGPIFKEKKQLTKKVAIHFRFGDYVGNSFYAQLWETSYYVKAIQQLQYNTNTDTKLEYYAFSDDARMAAIELAKLENYLESPATIIYGNIDISDLACMSECDVVIMANSSFSWWGAYLGKDKKVYAPKKWFSETAGLDTKDLYCEHWSIVE